MRRPVLPFPVALLGALLAALVAGGCAPLLRSDPAARWQARRSAQVVATVDSATLEDGHLVQAVRVRGDHGLAVDLLLKRPAPAAGGPAAPARVPLVLLLGGHHTGREAARLVPDTRGHAIAAISYPYHGRHRLGAWGALRAAPAIRRALLDTPAAIRLALDWLWVQPWADTTRVEGVGVSLGVPLMTVATALDPRITRLWSVHGAGDNRRLLSHGARRHVRWKPARWAVVSTASALVSAPELSAERWVGRVAPRPFVMINATEDERLPRAAMDALWAAARAPRERIWLPGLHVQRTRPEIVRQLVTTVLTRMAAPTAPAD